MSSKVEEDSRLSAKQRSLISRSSRSARLLIILGIYVFLIPHPHSYVNSVGMLASALNGDRVGQEKRVSQTSFELC